MSDRTQAFLESAKSLSRRERAEIAEGLLADLDAEADELNDTEFDKAWSEEAERRMQGFADGTISSEDGESVFNRLREKYRK